MNIQEKLLQIQSKLKAPKGQYNSFGKYKYRSLEDISEAVKPLLSETKTILYISDSIELLGDRYYVKATATLQDTESKDNITVTAYAREREIEDKKGMDASQITGATSSYARKYALNGLFALDDTKDADTDEYTNQAKSKTNEQKNQEMINKAKSTKIDKVKVETIKKLAEEKGSDISNIETYFETKLEDFTLEQFTKAIELLNRKSK